VLGAALAVLLGACSGGGRIDSARITGDPALDARLRLSPSPALLEALDHGVPLTLRLRLRADGSAGRLEREHAFELSFLPLARRYRWRDLDDGDARYFARRPQLLAALDRVRVPLDLAWARLPADTRYTLDIALDRDSLPAPLRLPALLSPQWRLDPPAYRWTAGD
jgi:hypothetical protein